MVVELNQPPNQPCTNQRSYAGDDGSFTFFEDDGASTDYLTKPSANAVRQTHFVWSDAKRELSWTVEGPASFGKSANDYDTVRVALYVAVWAMYIVCVCWVCGARLRVLLLVAQCTWRESCHHACVLRAPIRTTMCTLGL